MTRNAERGTWNPERGTWNTEHLTLHPLVALPHLRFMFSAINTKWEGDIGLYVALPLNDQPANDSKSEVEVRLIEFKEFVGFEVPKKRDVAYSI